ncbi:hypothetical protein AURDEDRAFT_169920 [Auricularia subglabra TFB-10046 SS5]|uniref:DUF6533 domain-containing protein n=1 Tax=Auricularia subglabra (strain TFB-10046 / SS5) TaxID=717982 RepID=J0WWZ0_AURST|nr:hypothetical protein AURDEDRAFT_169920 [Auricularia subglabra TFB-10046 SS5]
MATALAHAIDAFRQAQISNYAGVSSLAVLVYDMTLTHSLEAKHIWRSRWSVPKIMYLFARYYALFHLSLIVRIGTSRQINLTVSRSLAYSQGKSHSSFQLCDAYFRIDGFGTQVLANVTDALLIMRLRSMYRKSKIGKRNPSQSSSHWLTGCSHTHPRRAFLQAIIEAVAIGFSTSGASAVSPPAFLRSWTGCFYSKNPPRYVLAAWVPSLLFATILFGMTLHKLWVFRQDGIRASGLIFGLQLMNTLTTAFAPVGRLLELGVPWLLAAYGIVSSRLILNLREYNAEIKELTAPPMRTTGSELQFRHSESTAVEGASRTASQHGV